jgi:hypothetical protein
VLPHDERENGPLSTDGHEELYAIVGVGAPSGRAFRPAPGEARAIDPQASG